MLLRNETYGFCNKINQNHHPSLQASDKKTPIQVYCQLFYGRFARGLITVSFLHQTKIVAPTCLSRISCHVLQFFSRDSWSLRFVQACSSPYSGQRKKGWAQTVRKCQVNGLNSHLSFLETHPLCLQWDACKILSVYLKI